MSKERAAKAITVVVILCVLVLAVLRKANIQIGAKSEKTPQDTVYAMLEAARTGNSRGYLDHYTGQMESTLRQTVVEKGEAEFKNYLQTTNSALKGFAVFEPKPISDSEVRLRVEYVYQDRNEAQTMFLEKRLGEWKIARIDSAERVKTLVPYGTPVQ